MTILTFPALKQTEVLILLKELAIVPSLEDITIVLKIPTIPTEYTDKLAKMGVNYLTPIID